MPHLRNLNSTLVRPLATTALLLNFFLPISAAEPPVAALSAGIRSQSLRGHLSFIASDLLEGRDTPSRGLDIAAEYIAAQFRRAGLEPAVGDSYFQAAKISMAEQNLEAFNIVLENGKQVTRAIRFDAKILGFSGLELRQAPVFKAAIEQVATLTPEAVSGKVLLLVSPEPSSTERARQFAFFQLAQPIQKRLAQLKPAAVVILTPTLPVIGFPSRRVADAEIASKQTDSQLVVVSTPDWKTAVTALPEGDTPAKISIFIPTPIQKDALARNVAGILRGSDPALKDTYVLVTAHYDHLGMANVASGDLVYNGANDDGSGTVSVVELAGALAALPVKPKRSILFMTYFGEEKGLVGSRYYGRHPLVPLSKTVADINLEQVGRTDEEGGAQVGTASLTGFDFSEVTNAFVLAGEQTGVKVYKHPTNSDQYFAASDNQALADQGIPAHTICTAFAYPDYHQLGDHWDKVDYANMEKVDRMIALGVWKLADSDKAPQWNADNPKVSKYIEASKKLIPSEPAPQSGK